MAPMTALPRAPWAPRLLRFVPPLGWTGLIAWFSTADWAAGRTRGPLLAWLSALLPWADATALEALHGWLRTGAHVGEYAVLAGLWAWALGSRGWALGLSAATAVLDEAHQAVTPGRGGSPVDVALDLAGAGLALAGLRGWASVLDTATQALLWIAAAGGAALLLLHLAAGAPGGWLWLSTPLAWAALAVRRGRRGPRPGPS
jgi:VanZ family protein